MATSADAKRRVEQIAESRMLLLLQLNGYGEHCDEWRILRDALIEYGHAVLVGWGVGGKLRSKASAHKGVIDAYRIPEGLRLSRDDADALGVDVLIKSIDSFRVKVLAQNRWHPEGGASLTTYFIGWCLMHLPTAYEQWNRRENPRQPTDVGREQRPETMPERATEAVLGAAAAREVLDDEQLVEMFEMRASGHNDRAIAEQFGLREGVVRTRLSRSRQRMKRWKDQHE